MDLISLHIPKTGGTSYYDILKQVYGPALDRRYRRRDYLAAAQLPGGLEQAIAANAKVLHGHFHYPEIKTLHQRTGAKLVTWLRDPVERVCSNFRFFKYRLENTEVNPQNYERNKHRIQETLLEYASLPECQNVMTRFTTGASLEDFFFIGLQERFTKDVHLLGKQLNWGAFDVPYENVSTPQKHTLSKEELDLLRKWNAADIQLYLRVLELRQLPVPEVYQAFRDPDKSE